MPPNQMPQNYGQYGGNQYNQHNNYQQPHSQQHYTQPPPQMHQQQQPYGNFNQPQEFVPRHNTLYQPQYQQYPQQVYHQDTVNYANNSQHAQPITNPVQMEPKRQRKLLEIVDPKTKKAIEVPSIERSVPPPPVIMAAPVAPVAAVPAPEDEKKKDNINREMLEKVRQELLAKASDALASSAAPTAPAAAAPAAVAPPAAVPQPVAAAAAPQIPPSPVQMDFSVPPPDFVPQNNVQPTTPRQVLDIVPPPAVQQEQPQQKTPEAPAKPEVAQPEVHTPVSSPPAPETVTTTPASGTAESASTGPDVRVTPTLQKEESKEEVEDDKFEEEERVDTPEVTESQTEKTPEELAQEKEQKEAEEKEKKRLQEKELEGKVEKLIQSDTVDVANGCYGREFMVTIREIEKLFSRTPCPLTPTQLADFGLDIKTMRVADKKPNFTPNWVPNKGVRNSQPYRGRTTTDGTGRGAPQNRDQRGHPKRPPVVRQSIERVQRVALPSSKDAWKPERQKTSENIPEEEAAIKEVCKKVRALMNKVTPTSQKPLTEEFISYNVISNPKQLAQVVEIVFDKAVEEPKFCALYAEMCQAQVNSEISKVNKKSLFRDAILIRTQKVFQDKRDIDEEKEAAIEKEEDPVKREALLVEEKQKFRRRRFGVMGFIGHLFRNALLSTKIIHICTVELFLSIIPKKVDGVEQPLRKEDIDEESVHCGIQLIETVGATLDKSKDEFVIFLNQWLQKLELAKPMCTNKIRFMIMNLIELRKDKWIPRKSAESGPKKITDIHKEVRQEQIENEKARDQYDRRHGQGGGVRPNSNSLRKQVPVSRNSLDRNRATQQPDQKRAQAAANTKLQASNVAPKNISLSSMDNATLGKNKKEWHSGSSGGGNAADTAAAPVKPQQAWARRDSNDQRKKSAVDEKQSALAAAKEMGSMQLSARRSTSQTSIPDKVEEELTEEEKELRKKIMNTVKSDIGEVISTDLSLEDMAASFKDQFVGKEKYGAPSLTVVFEMAMRAVIERDLKENERKQLAYALRISLVSKVEKQAFIDGVTRFCKYCTDIELYYDVPSLWSTIAEMLMNTMHADHEVIDKAKEKSATNNIETIALKEMEPAFMAAKTEGKKKYDLFVQLMKQWTDVELAEHSCVDALSWEFDELPFKEAMIKDGLRSEMEAVTTNNGSTLAALLLK
ncbi:hypothetical protein CAEBREN_31007 [Caenorhabditis brenneri]|uniref:MIF4G domain-containing protein n=1 Tax=Caenorhabditis brenneri TaxID=135651 RepID=G0PKS3_CAEBE|nr:hypothetical protein CAEBREN_31007 [Caenorhabditis brenneri]